MGSSPYYSSSITIVLYLLLYFVCVRFSSLWLRSVISVAIEDLLQDSIKGWSWSLALCIILFILSTTLFYESFITSYYLTKFDSSYFFLIIRKIIRKKISTMAIKAYKKTKTLQVIWAESTLSVLLHMTPVFFIFLYSSEFSHQSNE